MAREVAARAHAGVRCHARHCDKAPPPFTLSFPDLGDSPLQWTVTEDCC